jgi:hypothetical protein
MASLHHLHTIVFGQTRMVPSHLQEQTDSFQAENGLTLPKFSPGIYEDGREHWRLTGVTGTMRYELLSSTKG